MNHQQSVQIQSQKQLLAEKHKELFELDAQIDQYTEELRKEKSRNNHIEHKNRSSAPNPTGEQDVLEMDHGNLANFGKRTNGGVAGTSGSFRARSRNSRKLETLLEVEEEVSDGHTSNKSSTEDLTQGPGPPMASRVTALKSRFEAEGVKDRAKFRNAFDRLSNGTKTLGEVPNADQKFSNGLSKLLQRVEPEGIETRESPIPEMFHEERRRNDKSGDQQFLVDSSLASKPSDQGDKTKTGLKSKLQEGSFEFSQSLEIKRILGESDSKTEASSWNSGTSTPSDSGDGSGLSSPSSLSSFSSTSSNSTSPKAAVFAVTGMAKKTDNSIYPFESSPYQNAIADRSVSLRRDFEGNSKGKNLQSSRAKVEEPGLNINSARGAQDELMTARRVKSDAFPTRHESVGSIARPTVLDFSRAGTKPKPLGSLDNRNGRNAVPNSNEKLKPYDTTNGSNDIAKAPSLKEGKSNRFDVTNSSGDGKTATSLAEEKAVRSSGKLQLSRLQYPTVLDDRKIRHHATLNSELSQTLSQREVRDQLSETTALPGESRRTMETAVEQNFNKEKIESNATSLSTGLIRRGEVVFSPSSGSANAKQALEQGQKTLESSIEHNSEKTELNARNINTNGAIRDGEVLSSSPSASSVFTTASLVGTDKKTYSSFEDSRGKPESRATASRSPQNSMSMSSFIENGEVAKSSPISAHLNKENKQELAGGIMDETDNAKKLRDEQSPDRPTFQRSQLAPLTFKPISFRAKKLAKEVLNDNSSANRSQLAPSISNSISVRGQSSLTKITVTPSATFFSSPAPDIPEKRSPVPTSKRTKFFLSRVAAPTNESGEENICETNNQNGKESEGNDRYDKETRNHEVSMKGEEIYLGSEGTNTNQQREKTEGSHARTREAPRVDAKQVVSSVNIQLSSQRQQPIQEKKPFSSPKETRELNSSVDSTSESQKTISQIADGKEFNCDSSSTTSGGTRFGSARPRSGNGRLNSESHRLNTENGHINIANGSSENRGLYSERDDKFESENGKNTAEHGITKNESAYAGANTNVFSSSVIKLSPPKQVSTLAENNANRSQFVVRESLSSMNNEKSSALANGELSQGEPSSTRTSANSNSDYTTGSVKSSQSLADEENDSPAGENRGLQNMIRLGSNKNGMKPDERVPVRNQSERSVKTMEFITSKGLPVTTEGDMKDIGLISQSKNVLSDQSPSALNTSPLMAATDNNAKSVRPAGLQQRISDGSDDASSSIVDQRQISGAQVLSKEINALRESADAGQASARKATRKKKAQRVSLDPHAVLLDAAVEGELDLVKQIVHEVSKYSHYDQ